MEDSVIAMDQRAPVRGSKAKFVPCSNGAYVWVESKGKRQLRLMDEEEFTNKGDKNECNCEVCTKQAAFRSYTVDLMEKDRRTRSGKCYNLK